MAELNVPLLRKMVDYVTSLPVGSWELVTVPAGSATWMQHLYVRTYGRTDADKGVLVTEEGIVGDVSNMKCGTAACLAGHTVLQHAPVGTRIVSRGVMEVQVPGRPARTIASYARELLGLTVAQAGRLFDGDNTAGDLRRLSGEYIAKAEAKHH
jgi:hypothetical protein